MAPKLRYASKMSGDRPTRYQYALRDLFLATLIVAAVCALVTRMSRADAGIAVLLVITLSFAVGALLNVTAARFGSYRVNNGQRRHRLGGSLLWGGLLAAVVTLLLLIPVLMSR